MADKNEFGKRVSNMVLFLEKLVSGLPMYFVEDPVEVGEDFLKMGSYLIKPYLNKDQFIKIMGELWDDVPDEEEDEEEVLFEAD